MSKISKLQYLLIIVFAIGSWIDVNGLWVELPLLVPRSPEQWTLPSYLSVIIQVANIGPLIVTIINCRAKKGYDVPIIHVILAVGALSCLFLAFFWDRTLSVAGTDHSVVLFLLVFTLAFTDCTSSIVFLTFMSRFPVPYMTALYIGEGLSGFIPSVVALIQGVGGDPVCVNGTNSTATNSSFPVYPDPRFSVRIFFVTLFLLLVLCIAAFTALNCVLRRKRDTPIPTIDGAITVSQDASRTSQDSSIALIRSTEMVTRSTNVQEKADVQLTKRDMWILLSCMACICAMILGILPSIQTYTCIPYGSRAYHLSVTLGNMANPMACMLAFFLPTSSIAVVLLVSSAGLLVASYLLMLGAQSPCPILNDSAGGEVLVILAWILVNAFISYARVSIACMLRSKGRRGLLICGATAQAGAALGSLLTFLLVNIFSQFHSSQPCQALVLSPVTSNWTRTWWFNREQPCCRHG